MRVYGYRSLRAYGYRAPAPGYQALGPYGVGPPVGYGYLPSREQIETDPDVYPVGSDWWQAMDALDGGGQGNGSGSQ